MIPTIVTPTYEVKLFSINKPVKYRPFLVKEEKLLLMAQQGDDPAEIERAVKQLVTDCTFGAIDPDALPSFDLEMLFLQLRAKSVNNLVELRYECKNKRPEVALPLEDEDDGICHAMVTCPVNLDDVKVTVPAGHTRKVMVTDTIGCTMRYPTNKHLKVFAATSSVDAVNVIAECIENIFQATGEVFETKDATPEEVRTFVESMSLSQAKKFQTFFDTLPHLEHTFEFKCPKCGYAEKITLSGLMDFFD